MTNEEIFEIMFERYGESEQIHQAMGECGEFIAAAQNYYRSKKYGHKKTELFEMISEAADAYIMMLQMRHIDPEMFDGCVQSKMGLIRNKISKYSKEEWG